MIWKKKKINPAINASKTIALVNELIANKVLKLEAPVFYVFNGLLIGKGKKNIVKNLFLYARILNHVSEKDTIYVKDLETEQLIAVHNNKQGTIFL